MLSTGMGEGGASIGRQHVILSTGMRRLGIAYCEMSTGSSCDTTQSSFDTTQSSCDTKQSSCGTTHSSCDTTQSSRDTTQSSCDTTQSTSPTSHPYETYQIPSVQDDSATKRCRISCRFSLYPSQSCATSVKYHKS